MRRLLALLMIAGCSSAPPVPPVRFVNAPPVTIVNDRHHVPKQPKPREFVRYLYAFDGAVMRPMTRALDLERHRRALGVNALDEVPNSTWFTNRIGVRDVSPEEILNPPGAVGSPEKHKPWTIESSKVGGMTVGFIVKDARGEKFLLKFDPRGFPEAETSAHIISGRLLWAFGYNVTDDYIAYIKADDLKLAPDAVIKDLAGHKMPLTKEAYERSLARIEKAPDGTMRVMMSHYLDGKPLGGHPGEGVREDDPNDRIPHEMRRDLRGTYVAFSWLDHNDLHEGQMVDMFVKDPEDPGRKYVKHYFIDFGISLGFAATKNREPRFGHEWMLDPRRMFTNLLTFGIVDEGYETRKRPKLRGVGHYEIDTYDPGDWKSHTPGYRPVYAADRFDKFWASKILMKFKREHIRAAVEAARLSDPRSVEWLTDAIIARQRKTAAYWFNRVNPLDQFAVDTDGGNRRLCFSDLAITNAFTRAIGTHYTLTAYTRDNRRLGAMQVAAGLSGVTCGDIRLSTSDPESYTIVRIDTRRPGFKGTTFVHVAQQPRSNAIRVIGIWRE
jgi:hypothetical protein